MDPPVQRIDLYTAVHKSLRRELFRMAERVGSTDFHDTLEADALATRFRVLAERLRSHRMHEDHFIHPLLAEKAPELERALSTEHEEDDGELAGLESAFERARERDADPAAALEFYRALNVFIAGYLTHLDREERVMALLADRCTTDELLGVMRAFHESRSEDVSVSEMVEMLPSLNPGERAAMLVGMRRTLSPEAYARAVAASHRMLADADRDRLAEVLA